MARRTFTVTIRGDGPPWSVEVEYRAGEALPVVVAGSFVLDAEALRASASPRAYGERLGEALFHGAVRDVFVRAAVRADTPLHVQLELAAEELRDLAWETLCGPLDGRFEPLGLDQRLALSRFVPSAADRGFAAPRPGELRALAVIAEPRGLENYGLAPIDAATAMAALRRGLGEVPFDVLGSAPGAIGPATLDALCATLTTGRYTLLHVIAHGRQARGGGTGLFLVDAGGAVDVVGQGELIARLRVITEGMPHFVFLAACESGAEAGGTTGLARVLVSELGLPALVAMQRRVSIDTAHAFTAAFYARLLVHGYVDQAAVEAIAGLAGREDALVPAVYGRLGARPLFATGTASTRPPAPVDMQAVSATMAEVMTGMRGAMPPLFPASFGPSLAPETRKKLWRWLLLAAMIAVVGGVAFQIYLAFRGPR
jgi:hypothetical protein